MYRRGPFKGMIHIGADDVGRELVGEDNIRWNNAIVEYYLTIWSIQIIQIIIIFRNPKYQMKYTVYSNNLN